jgi:hypothetical protein
MNGFQINSMKAYLIVGMTLLLLVVAFSSPVGYNRVQASAGDAFSFERANTSLGYCSASRSLVQRTVLRRLQRLDFALSDGRGNALGLRSAVEPGENVARARKFQRLDFALSDGRGNALGLRDSNISLASNMLTTICLNAGE